MLDKNNFFKEHQTYCTNTIFKTIYFSIVSFICTIHLGDNCVQNVHLGRFIVGYMVGSEISFYGAALAEL